MDSNDRKDAMGGIATLRTNTETIHTFTYIPILFAETTRVWLPSSKLKYISMNNKGSPPRPLSAVYFNKKKLPVKNFLTQRIRWIKLPVTNQRR